MEDLFVSLHAGLSDEQGAEPATVPSLSAAFEAGKPVTVEAGGTLADGLLVPTVGSNAFQICQKHVDKCDRQNSALN